MLQGIGYTQGERVDLDGHRPGIVTKLRGIYNSHDTTFMNMEVENG